MIAKIKFFITENTPHYLLFLALLFFVIQPHNPEISGIASWYGGGEILNEHTANGELFDPGELTCASWNYTFGTTLRITNYANGNSIIVRVNDRGPNKRLGRIIDLTKKAFSEIADIKEGLIKVKIEKVEPST